MLFHTEQEEKVLFVQYVKIASNMAITNKNVFKVIDLPSNASDLCIFIFANLGRKAKT